MHLHHEDHGHGPPLIILHGLFGSLENWRTISRHLAARFRVIAVDQRNHGHSPHSPEMNYPAMAQDVLKLMGQLGLKEAGVLGHSMGGKTAMQLALHHPEAVRKLVVVDISPRYYSPRHGQIFTGLLSLDLNVFHTRHHMEEALAPHIPELSVRRFLLKNIARTPAGGFRWKLNLQDIFHNYAHIRAAITDGTPFLKPALFVRGGRSDYLPEQDQPLVHRLFPHAQFHTIPQAGHWLHAEAPQEFVRLVEGFL